MKKLTNQQFIDRANFVHKFKYKYLGKYTNIDALIQIECTVHGSFYQRASDHLGGRGCKECGTQSGAIKRTTKIDKFLEQAKAIHQNKYDYSLVDYKNNKTPIIIICSIHGNFDQRPFHHLSGQGCPFCGNKKQGLSKTNSQEYFVKKANKIHKNKYDYSLSIYTGTRGFIIIKCPIHTVFTQRANDHLSGAGCPLCVSNANKGKNKFIIEANDVHKNKYDYSLVIYKNSKSKVKIICPKHSSFWQKPNAHLIGNGCPNCSTYISKPETDWLNYLNIPLEQRQIILKVGKKQIRTDAFDLISNTIYEFNGDYYHGNPNIFSADKINETVKKTFGDLYQKTLKKEQLLKSFGYNVISIWESDWKKLQKEIKSG